MTGEELDAALRDVQKQEDMVDRRAATLAELLVGRLRLIGKSYSNRETLRKLKAELQRFDARSGAWRD